MRLFRWFSGRGGGGDSRLGDWREAWTRAAAEPDASAVAALRERLDALALPEDETEIEREMLDGLEALVELARTAALSGLPAIVTGHRIVGPDTCHFTAPASMPDEPLQPSGRLILTSTRAIFVGGRGLVVPWHAVGETLRTDRDLVLVRRVAGVARFRCNSFADALCAAFLAARIVGDRLARPPGPV